MDTMELNYSEDSSDDLNREQSQLSADSVECDFWREQKIFPRMGDEYQVEIPVLLEEKSDYIYHKTGPMEVHSHPLKLCVGASPRVISIKRKDENSRHEKKDKLEKVKSDVERHEASECFKLTKCLNDHSEVNEVEPDYDLLFASHSWSKTDRASFLLGLYIFEQNFVLVKRFLENKKMQDILSFYYGEFYQSHEYCRWSESQKMKRGVVGPKIFARTRKKKLLSRILPGMSVERRNSASEVWKMFEEEKIKFEEFIISIKDLVGINVLVEAVGIGKGKKKDLTTMALETSRSNQVIPVIPGRIAWSSLKLSEIVKYLNGERRLTKLHSYDLFWENVWPRLLARGWHSEQPKGQVYTPGPKSALVFLVPGITKFCRRSLKKGNHYFDCERDVLNKVASDPQLIELETDEDESNGKEEDREMKNKRGNLPSQKHCYLQPRTTNHTTEGMKFTVVDTSLGDGKPYKVRELSDLIFDISHKLNSYIESIVDDNIFEFSVEEMGDVDTCVSNEASSSDNSKGSVNLSNMKHLDIRDSMQIQHHCPDSGSVDVNENEDSGIVGKRRKAPVIKRRRLSDCNRAETCKTMTTMAEVPVKRGQEIPGPVMMNIPVVSAEVKPGNPIFCSAVDKLPLHSSPKSNTRKNVGCADISNSNVVPDLNLAPDCENETECNREHDEIAKGQLNDVTQRRGTRNRLPTTRALEAVACGFLSMNNKRRDRPRKSTSRRDQGKTEGSDTQINALASIQDIQNDPP